MSNTTGDMTSNSLSPKYDNVKGNSGKEALVSKEQQERQKHGFCGCWAWFKADPWKRKSFFYWILFALATILFAIIYFASEMGGYVATGIAVLLLTGLKEQVDKYSNLNESFKQENQELNSEVDKLNKAQLELQSVEGDLKEGNKRLEDSLIKFKQLDKNLQSLGSSNLEGMKFIQEKSKKMMDDWRSNLIQQEKDLISEVFDRFEMKDDQEDMNKQEFNQFLKALPQKYQQRTKTLALDFDKIAGDDQILSLDEFQKMLDIWVEKGIDLMLEEQKNTPQNN